LDHVCLSLQNGHSAATVARPLGPSAIGRRSRRPTVIMLGQAIDLIDAKDGIGFEEGDKLSRRGGSGAAAHSGFGARFETAGLVDIITRRTVEDSVKDVGALPLLSYTLDDTRRGPRAPPAATWYERLQRSS
jgi:hypothetical protein